jgi:hypothetical protein
MQRHAHGDLVCRIYCENKTVRIKNEVMPLKLKSLNQAEVSYVELNI